MEMSLEQYILNPALKTNAVLNASTRELIKANYQRKFDNVMLKENGKVTYYLYTEDKKNTYWAYFKVPSEVVPKFYYDVVFKFTPTTSSGFVGDLFKYNVRFFSNDPNFVFTYAYVFNKNELFIRELQSKMSKEALKKAPEEKNPTEQISYEKAIYFAYLIMKERNLNKISKFKSEAKSLDVKEMLTNIMPADEKIQTRQEEGKRYDGKKKTVISKQTFDNLRKAAGGKLDLSNSNIKVATTKKVKTISRVNSAVKNTKTTPKK